MLSEILTHKYTRIRGLFYEIGEAAMPERSSYFLYRVHPPLIPLDVSFLIVLSLHRVNFDR